MTEVMDQMPDWEGLQADIDEATTGVKSVLDKVKDFLCTCIKARTEVTSMAEILIAKIKEHEQRLLDDIDTWQHTEMKKLHFSQEKLLGMIDSLELLQKKATEFSCLPYYQNITDTDYDELVQKLGDLENDYDYVDNAVHICGTQNLFPVICFVPIKCNTAFGTIDDEIGIEIKKRQRR